MPIPGTATHLSKLHSERGGWPGTPWSLFLSLWSALKPRMAVLATRYSSSFELAPLAWWSYKQLRSIKTKVGSQKVLTESNQWTQSISVVKRCKIPDWPDVGAHWSTLEMIKLALWVLHPWNLTTRNQKLRFGNPFPHGILPFTPPNSDISCDVNVILQKPPHNWDITRWCSDDVILSFGRKVCACTLSSEHRQSLWVECQSECSNQPST